MNDFPNDTVDMDALFNKPFNEDSAAEVEKASLAPEGYYLSNPDEYPLTMAPYLFDGRRLVAFTGIVEGRVAGEFHKTLATLKVSPDKRHARVWVDGVPTDEEKAGYDMASILWTQARKAYVLTCGEGPKTEAALLDFIKCQPLKWKVGHFQGKLTVKGIEKAR